MPRTEKALYQAVDRALPKFTVDDRGRCFGIFRQSMTGTATRGTPDRYYDGSLADLWAEYKNLKYMPRDGKIKAEYTPDQLQWMKRRERGLNVVGIVGTPKGVVIQMTSSEWRDGTRVKDAEFLTPRQVAEWITRFCGA